MLYLKKLVFFSGNSILSFILIKDKIHLTQWHHITITSCLEKSVVMKNQLCQEISCLKKTVVLKNQLSKTSLVLKNQLSKKSSCLQKSVFLKNQLSWKISFIEKTVSRNVRCLKKSVVPKNQLFKKNQLPGNVSYLKNQSYQKSLS